MAYSLLLATLTWILATVFYAYQYILRVLPSTINQDLVTKFHISASQFGDFNSLYYIGYAGLHLPIGIIMARFGVKRILPLCILIAVIGMLPLMYCNEWTYPLWGRLLVGIGSSAGALGLIQIVRENFNHNKFSTLLGVSVACGLLCVIYAGEPLEYIISKFGWQEVLKFLSVIGLAIAALIYVAIPKPAHIDSDDGFKGVTWSEVGKVLFNPYVLLLGIIGGLMVGPLEGFADAWSKVFFLNVYNLDNQIAGRLGSMIFLGMALGCATIGFISEKLRAYYLVTITSACAMAASFFYMLSGNLDVNLLYILMPVIGYFSAYQILVVTMAADFVSPKYQALASILVNTIMMSFGTVFHSSIGRLMNHYWDGAMNGQDMVYSAYAYQNSLAVIPYALIIAGIAIALMIISIRLRKIGSTEEKFQLLKKS